MVALLARVARVVRLVRFSCHQTLRGDSPVMPAPTFFRALKIHSTWQFHRAYDSNLYKRFPQNRERKFYCTVMQDQFLV